MSITASYSIATGKRVSEKFAKSQPSKAESFTVDLAIITKNKIPQDTDGAPLNIEAARMAKRLGDAANAVKEAKKAERRANYKAKKAAEATKQVGKDPKKFTAKKTSRVVKRNTEGEFAPNNAKGPGITPDLVKLPAKKAVKKAPAKKAAKKSAK